MATAMMVTGIVALALSMFSFKNARLKTDLASNPWLYIVIVLIDIAIFVFIASQIPAIDQYRRLEKLDLCYHAIDKSTTGNTVDNSSDSVAHEGRKRTAKAEQIFEWILL